MIPAEAVEAAENAYYETLAKLRLAEGGGFKVGSQVKRSIRAALEAAAPYILEGAWDEGMEAMYATTSSEWPPIPDQNPHRSKP